MKKDLCSYLGLVILVFMSDIRPKSAIGKRECPLNDSEIDVIPECYHYTNRCLCFMCKCGLHRCPSQKKSFYTRDAFKSNYQRNYSRPSVTPTPQKLQALYTRNTQKMDLETEYMKKFPGFTVECIPVVQSITPQPSFRFDGKSQYNRDFPNWGPVDYANIKRPIQPVHDTKLKFQAMSSYDYFYQSVKPPVEVLKKTKSLATKGQFKIPLQSSSQRDYQKISSDHFPQHEQRRIESYVPVCYNPGQFKTTANITYINASLQAKNPMQIRKQALFNGS